MCDPDTLGRAWQDVEQQLESGISVMTTVNLQYIEELRLEVERITGKRSAYSIPRGFLDSADDGPDSCRFRTALWNCAPLRIRCSSRHAALTFDVSLLMDTGRAHK